jgi:hypothetical protein
MIVDLLSESYADREAARLGDRRLARQFTWDEWRRLREQAQALVVLAAVSGLGVGCVVTWLGFIIAGR